MAAKFAANRYIPDELYCTPAPGWEFVVAGQRVAVLQLPFAQAAQSGVLCAVGADDDKQQCELQVSELFGEGRSFLRRR